MKAKAADNQRLAEVAKAAEQLQKENKVMAHRLQMCVIKPLSCNNFLNLLS
jgi:hypothetical protein